MLDGKIISTIKKNTKQVVEKITTLETNVRNLSNNFNTWKDYWTSSRANKLDNLDKSLSGVESNLESKIDRLGSASSQSGGNVTIALGNLSNKIDALKQDVGTKSSQTTVNKVGQDLNNIASTITSKIDTVESKVNQTNTTLATKANQNTVDAVANTANQINTALASKASQASVNTLQSTANNIYNKLGTGSVKMVQRGLVVDRNIVGQKLPNADTYTNIQRYYKDVTLPYSVNTSKAVAFLETANYFSSNSSIEDYACQLVGSNTLRLIWIQEYSSTVQGCPVFSWQVIEFY